MTRYLTERMNQSMATFLSSESASMQVWSRNLLPNEVLYLARGAFFYMFFSTFYSVFSRNSQYSRYLLQDEETMCQLSCKCWAYSIVLKLDHVIADNVDCSTKNSTTRDTLYCCNLKWSWQQPPSTTKIHQNCQQLQEKSPNGMQNSKKSRPAWQKKNDIEITLHNLTETSTSKYTLKTRKTLTINSLQKSAKSSSSWREAR